jgi:hypothetical protein
MIPTVEEMCKIKELPANLTRKVKGSSPCSEPPKNLSPVEKLLGDCIEEKLLEIKGSV